MIEDILNKHGDKMVKAIQDNIVSSGENTSGETAKSVRKDVVSKSGVSTLTVVGGRKFFPAVETGTKPSKKKPSPEMVESLESWALKKGAKVSAWGAAVNILKYGSKLWQLGGRKDIYTNVKNESVQPLIDEIREYERDQIVKSMINVTNRS